jgi:hypothetical protein
MDDKANKHGDGGGGNVNGTWDGLTGEQKAVSDTVFELHAVGQRFEGISERLAAASRDRNFAREYLAICDLIPELKQRLDDLDRTLHARALAAMEKRKADK